MPKKYRPISEVIDDLMEARKDPKFRAWIREFVRYHTS